MYQFLPHHTGTVWRPGGAQRRAKPNVGVLEIFQQLPIAHAHGADRRGGRLMMQVVEEARVAIQGNFGLAEQRHETLAIQRAEMCERMQKILYNLELPEDSRTATIHQE